MPPNHEVMAAAPTFRLIFFCAATLIVHHVRCSVSAKLDAENRLEELLALHTELNGEAVIL